MLVTNIQLVFPIIAIGAITNLRVIFGCFFNARHIGKGKLLEEAITPRDYQVEPCKLGRQTNPIVPLSDHLLLICKVMQILQVTGCRQERSMFLIPRLILDSAHRRRVEQCQTLHLLAAKVLYHVLANSRRPYRGCKIGPVLHVDHTVKVKAQKSVVTVLEPPVRYTTRIQAGKMCSLGGSVRCSSHHPLHIRPARCWLKAKNSWSRISVKKCVMLPAVGRRHLCKNELKNVRPHSKEKTFA